ncbi:hypothetical protein AHMF7605_05980 [Adhaeribacter arboris]|uniref:STAS/SEC14 domain-containing protein n=1 Tax=Adhaeribacter arboris TaxID=2072846 RepID=A0A2T2YC69_9BACT|nr:hypothetical protein [Adhaeribacter arboris]PSR53107.1 hypothetical protein AHMF7605_05980 [Adhaeribacter arboris]
MIDFHLETLYENDFTRIEWSKELALIQLTFRQHPEPERFRNSYHLAIDTAQRKEAKYWLTDARQIKTMEPENQSWLVQNMMPLLKSNQIRKFAIVMDPKCFVMTSPTKVYERPSTSTETAPMGTIKVHFDIEAACNWLFGEL